MGGQYQKWLNENPKQTVGWSPTCGCNAGISGGTVLDPFNGSGTTGMVAMKHGRKYVGIELNPDYIKMSEDRITKAINERPMFAAGLTKTGGGVA